MSLFSKPKYSTVVPKKKDIPKGLWTKCPISGEIVFNKELEANQMVVPKSGYHFQIGARERIAALIDPDTFAETSADIRSADPLGFVDSQPYTTRLKRYEKESGLPEAVICGTGRIHGIEIALAVMDFRFCGGTLGSATGEKITRIIETAVAKKIPCIIYSTSGGARMQEGILSLMQMAKTSAALGRLAAAHLPYISVLTDPTTGGVSASYATLGDVIIAEPRRAHRLCRTAGDQGNDQADASAGVSKRGVPAAARPDRPDRQPSGAPRPPQGIALRAAPEEETREKKLTRWRRCRKGSPW